MTKVAFTNCDIFTGSEVLSHHAVLVEDGRVLSIVDLESLSADVEVLDLDNSILAPGFIDLQVNGGGDVMFNDDPSAESLLRIGNAHRQFGTTDFLPTFITGEPSGMHAAAEAVREVARDASSGVLGVHFEGPCIAKSMAGVHDPSQIRPPDSDVVSAWMSLSDTGCLTLVSLAPELVDEATIRGLVRSGCVVSVGHSDATAGDVREASVAGVTGGTHLFNAMSQMVHRAPGVVGAALAMEDLWVSIIADGHHVDLLNVQAAWRAKRPGRLFLVTDAMPPVGGELGSYTIGPHTIFCRSGRCETADGLLGGSALDMATAVRNCIQVVGIDRAEAFRMASTYPAEFVGASGLGRIEPGYRANFVICNNEVHVRGVVVAGDLKFFG